MILWTEIEEKLREEMFAVDPICVNIFLKLATFCLLFMDQRKIARILCITFSLSEEMLLLEAVVGVSTKRLSEQSRSDCNCAECFC